MKKLLYILLPFVFGFKSEKKVPVQHRSFYIEMKRLEKPGKVTAFAAVQSATGVAFSGTSLSVTVSSTTANNLVVIGIIINSATGTVTSVTDNQSNTYVVSSPVTGSVSRIYQAYGVQTTGAVTSVTLNINASGPSFRMAINEYSGAATSNATVFDASTTGTGTGTSLSVSTLTPSATGNLIVATGGNEGEGGSVFTAGTNYTLYGTTANILANQYRLSSAATETAPMTISVSTNWVEIATSFKPAASATNTTRFFFNP